MKKSLGYTKHLLMPSNTFLGMTKLNEISSKSMQDYLRAIAKLSKNGDSVKTTEISKYFQIAPASVTEMIKKLSKKGFVNYLAYHGTTLTLKGKREAKRISRKHRLLEKFLSDILHLGKDKVHSQACEMEHTLTDETEESLCRFLKHPDTCPDDREIIPACDLPFSNCEECIQLHQKGLEEVGKRQKNLVSICDIKTGSHAKVTFIRGGRRVLQRLLDMGVTPGTEIKVERAASRKGPVEICVRGSKLAIGRGIAKNVFVEIP